MKAGNTRHRDKCLIPTSGIFWVVVGKPFIESIALSEAENYGDFKTHPCSHYEV